MSVRIRPGARCATNRNRAITCGNIPTKGRGLTIGRRQTSMFRRRVRNAAGRRFIAGRPGRESGFRVTCAHTLPAAFHCAFRQVPAYAVARSNAWMRAMAEAGPRRCPRETLGGTPPGRPGGAGAAPRRGREWPGAREPYAGAGSRGRGGAAVVGKHAGRAGTNGRSRSFTSRHVPRDPVVRGHAPGAFRFGRALRRWAGRPSDGPHTECTGRVTSRRATM